jgi:(p)ppGpp synthase/HD superfamily hydrolase
MPSRPRLDGKQIARALEFAIERHKKPRKGKPDPYATHLLRVASLVMQLGGDSNQVTAAFLHDTLEDTNTSEAELRRRFGPRVAAMVSTLSEPRDENARDGKGPYRPRKEAYLRQLRRADRKTRLVAACDKLDNLRDITSDLERHGASFLDRFTGTRRQTRWYYEQAFEAVGPALPAPERAEFERRLATLARYVPTVSPEP